MKNLILCVLIFIGSFQAFAQTRFQLTTGTRSSEYNYHLAATRGGNLIGTGHTWLGDTASRHSDAFLIKYNNLGKVLWSKTYGGSGNDYSWDVIVAQNADIVGAGYTSSFGTPKNAATLTRTDSTGAVKWLKGVYSSSYAIEFYRTIETSSSHILATGLIQSSADDIVLAKFTKKGHFLWARTIGTSSTDEAMGLMETSQGHYLVSGLTKSSSGNGRTDFAVAKVDTAGRLIWSKLYGGTADERLNSAIEINNSYFFAGWSKSAGAGKEDVILMKTDTAGKVGFVKAYGSGEDEKCFNLIEDNGSIILTGYTDKQKNGTRNTFLMKVAVNGALQWSYMYGGSGSKGHWPTGLASTWHDKGYYMFSQAAVSGMKGYELFLIKSDRFGHGGCDTKDADFKETSVTGWSATNFGALSKPTVTVSSGTITPKKWSTSGSVSCCLLNKTSLVADTFCIGKGKGYAGPSIVGYEYKWFKNGTAFSSKRTITLGYDDAGSYQLEISAPNGRAACSTQVDTFEIVADRGPQVSQDLVRLCKGDTIEVNLIGGFAKNTWRSEGKNTVVGSGDSILVTESDVLSTISITDFGCTFVDTVVVKAADYPVLAVADTASFCEADSVMLSASSNYDYYWNDDTLSKNIAYWADETGYVKIQSDNGHCSSIDSVWVIERPKPKPNLGVDTSLCSDDELCLWFNEKYEYTYWNNSRASFDTFCSTADTVIYVHAVNEYGCSGYDTLMINRVNDHIPLFQADTIIGKDSVMLNASAWHFQYWSGPDPTDSVGSIIYARATGWYHLIVKNVNDPCWYFDSIYVDLSVGITHPQNNRGISVFPNPAKKLITVRAHHKLSIVTILDLTGKVVIRNSYGTQLQANVDLPALNPGAYLVEVVTTQGITHREILVIE